MTATKTTRRAISIAHPGLTSRGGSTTSVESIPMPGNQSVLDSAEHTSSAARAVPDTQWRLAADEPTSLVPNGIDTHMPHDEGTTSDGARGSAYTQNLLAPSGFNYGTLRVLARQLDDLERLRKATANRRRSLTSFDPDEDGVIRGLGLEDTHPVVVATDAVMLGLDTLEKRAVKDLEKYLKSSPIAARIAETRGYGFKTVARLLGCIGDPYWNERDNKARTVSALWAYSGLHVIDGNAAKRRKGEQANWSTEAKTRAYLIAESQIKSRGKFRDAYDKRRAHTAQTHPDWTLGHSHNDAMRVVMKEVVKDLWLISRDAHLAEENAA